jgi:muconolactone delta-isomerase
MDTLIPTIFFTDSIQRKAVIKYKWREKEAYKFLAIDSAFRDLNGVYNDSVFMAFKVKSLEDYGVLILDIKLPDKPGQYIIQLLDDKEKIVQEKILTKSGETRFEYLNPGNYKLKSIADANSNGKWDTGNYKKNLLPEFVEYYPLPLSVRANWDLEEEWLLNY